MPACSPCWSWRRDWPHVMAGTTGILERRREPRTFQCLLPPVARADRATQPLSRSPSRTERCFDPLLSAAICPPGFCYPAVQFNVRRAKKAVSSAHFRGTLERQHSLVPQIRRQADRPQGALRRLARQAGSAHHYRRPPHRRRRTITSSLKPAAKTPRRDTSCRSISRSLSPHLAQSQSRIRFRSRSSRRVSI